MVEWAQMKLVVQLGLGMLVLVAWITLFNGSSFSRAVPAFSRTVASRPVTSHLVANPVLYVPKLEGSIFSAEGPCQVGVSCVE